MTLTYQTPHSIESVTPFFTDFKKFGELHPYIDTVSETSTGYHASESITFLGFIKNRNAYDVVVTLYSDNSVTYTSQIKKNVNVEINFTFTNSGGGTKIIETINITAPSLVKTILGNVMRSAHLKLVENLNALKVN